MKRSLLTFALLSIFAATSVGAARLAFVDSGMNYAAVDENTEMDSCHLSLAYEDGKLTVAIHSDWQEGQVATLRIDDLPRYVNFGSNPDAHLWTNTYDSRASAANKSVANLDDISQITVTRWGHNVDAIAVVHDRAGLDATIASYKAALERLGFTAAQESFRPNIRGYVFENGDTKVQLTFTRHGGQVTVRLREV